MHNRSSVFHHDSYTDNSRAASTYVVFGAGILEKKKKICGIWFCSGETQKNFPHVMFTIPIPRVSE